MKVAIVGAALAGLLLTTGCGSTPPESVNAQSEAPIANIATPAEETPPLPNIDTLLAFDDPARCIMGEALHGLVRDLARYEPETGRPMPGALPTRTAFRASLGEPVMTPGEDGLTVHLPLRGQWQGIEVTALDISYWNGGDPPAFAITMDASKDAALAMLNREGFDLPADGKRTIDDEVYTIEIELAAQSGHTRLSCSAG